MKAWEKRKKWLSKRTLWNCLVVSAALLVIAAIFEYARVVVTANLPTLEKTVHVLYMWLLLTGFLLVYGLLSPDIMETILKMLGFKEEEEKREKS